MEITKENASLSGAAITAQIDAKYNTRPKIKEYPEKCSVCGRPFRDILLKGEMIVGCPTNNMNHHAANKEEKEEKMDEAEAKINEVTKEKVKKPLKRRKKKE